MTKLALWMKQVADLCQAAGSEEHLADYADAFSKIHAEVTALATSFPVPGIN